MSPTHWQQKCAPTSHLHLQVLLRKYIVFVFRRRTSLKAALHSGGQRGLQPSHTTSSSLPLWMFQQARSCSHLRPACLRHIQYSARIQGVLLNLRWNSNNNFRDEAELLNLDVLESEHRGSSWISWKHTSEAKLEAETRSRQDDHPSASAHRQSMSDSQR